MGGNMTLKRSKRYSNDGYGGGDDNGRTACRQVKWQQHVGDADFLKGDKYGYQQEI
jgi:hypothetical protein